jgi:hypothetical protein
MSALGGTRTPNLLIRSYRRAPVRDQMLQLRRVFMPAQGGPGAFRLLYPTAVPDDSCQRERRQVWLDIGLSAWELACHILPTIIFAAQKLFSLSVSVRYRPLQTTLSGTRGARLLTLPPTDGNAGIVVYRRRGMSCCWTICLASGHWRWRGGGCSSSGPGNARHRARSEHPREHRRLRRDRTGARVAAPQTNPAHADQIAREGRVT